MLSRETRVVLVDQDGVLSDLEGRVIQLVKQRHPTVRFMDPPPMPWPFYIADAYPQECRHLVNAIMREPEFFATLPLVQDALEGWQRIIDAGFKPRICSSPLKVSHCPDEKRQWLKRVFVPHFGEEMLDTAIISRQKHLHEGVVLVDDRPPPIKGNDTATWEHVIFDRPCNRIAAAHGYVRLNGWRDPQLPQKLALAAERALQRRK